MILRLTLENLFSFCEETSISFVAGKGTSHTEQVCRAEKRDDISVLKAGVIYGANASGKSNIIKAIDSIRKIALSGVPKQDIKLFKLKEDNNAPSKIEIEFKHKGVYYAYGVVFSIKGIKEEWLYEVNSRSDKEIFTRQANNDSTQFTFGSISGSTENAQLLKFISQSTPVADSFLSEYVKRNGRGLDAIKAAHSWFAYGLKIIFPTSRYDRISVKVEKDNEFAAATKSLLTLFNTGIVDIRRTKVRQEDVDLPKNLLIDLLSTAEPNDNFLVSSLDASNVYFFETSGNGLTTIYKQHLIHKSDKGNDISFEMKEESDGSVRLLDFIPMLIDLSLNEVDYVVDEIDRSMHPMLSHKMLEFYFSRLSNERDTQLIFTTHESNLLNLDLIRSDEVWFAEKDRNGASHLTSLAEYKPREDVRKGYLQGRYGAIPFFAPINSLNW